MENIKYKVQEDGVYKVLPDGKEVWISEYMRIKKLTQNLETKELKAMLEFKALSEIREVLVDRSTYLIRGKLFDLINKGVDVSHDNVSELPRYFKSEEIRNSNNIENVHETLGFSKYNGQDIYKLGKTIGCNSTYVGDMDIEISGDEKEYLEMLKNEVLGNSALEFALIAGLSAIILGFIGEEVGAESLIIHWYSNSSTGKSTGIRLSISAFSTPDIKKNSLIGSYNGTNNALISKLSGLKGVPFALDELSLSSNENFTKFIYALANGKDKERLNKNSELTKSGNWMTTILSNGEKSLLSSSNRNAGLQVRVIEISNLKFTQDAGNSERINEIISRTHGHIAPAFAETLINEFGKEFTLKTYREVKADMYNTFQNLDMIDNFTERRVGKYAILLTTALVLQETIDQELDIDGIEKILIDVERESIKNRNFDISVIDYIKQYISKYKHKFSNGNNNNFTNETYGKLTKKKDYAELEIDKISFEEMLRAGGFEDKNVVLKSLKNDGLLDCENDRFTRSRHDNMGIKKDFYVIKLKD